MSTEQTQSSQQYSAFIRGTNQAIWCIELDTPISVKDSVTQQVRQIYSQGHVTETNLAAAKLYGHRSIKPLIGLLPDELIPQSDPANVSYLKNFIKAGYEVSDIETVLGQDTADSKYLRNSLIGDVQDNTLKRIWVTQQNITEQKQATEALQRSEQRLKLALRSSSMGLWEWNILTDTLFWSPELKLLYGLQVTDKITYEKYMSLVHPKDRSYTQKVIKKSRETGSSYQLEHRAVWPDGSVHWLLGKGQSFSRDGKLVRMIGTSMNIDNLKEAHELAVANTQLKTQRAQLLELNRTKDEFIALASHQLRTPATAVKQYISLLINEYAGPISVDQLQYLQIAFNSNERQLRIINDLLKTAQLDSSRYILEKNKQDISEIIKFAASELETTLEMKKQRLVLAGISKVELEFDANEMKLVIVNLLENASKYSYPDSEIKISMLKRADYVQINIEDKGVGIAKQDVRKIFDKFTRIDNDLSDTVSGSGLGLYWVKRIIGLHGGSIKVTSDIGKGASFKIRLPL